MATFDRKIRKYGFLLSLLVGTAITHPPLAYADSTLSLPIEQANTKASREVAADGNAQCADVLKECFLMAPEKRNQCYFSRGQHPFCAGTTLGTLALTRWNYSKDEDGSAALALTGEQTVNAQCLAQFDRQWSAALLSGTATDLTYKRLLKKLNECSNLAAIN